MAELARRAATRRDPAERAAGGHGTTGAARGGRGAAAGGRGPDAGRGRAGRGARGTAARAAAADRGRGERPVPGHQRRRGALVPGRAAAGAAAARALPVRASGDKPFCDGSHARTGFSGAKDPKRVPDRRDTYPGTQVTIFDNRGICQHSGFCTDRLPTVFRTDAGAVRRAQRRPDGRDRPRGARLPVRGAEPGFDDIEARDLADWHGIREQAIEVSLDGPYRVTGGLPLRDAAGEEVPRASGHRESTTRSAGAVTRRTSRSAAACTGTSSSAIRLRPGRADAVRVGRRPARADPDDPAAVRDPCPPTT